MNINKPILSRFCILLNHKDLYLVYSTLTNSFYKVNNELYRLLKSNDFSKLEEEDRETLNYLNSVKIISTEREDDSVVTKLEMRHNIEAYSTGSLGITLAPTVTCNLRCPYCFEADKPAGMISEKTCDDVLDFINTHQLCKGFSLNWFGGEPLIGINRIEYFLDRLHERVEKKESVPMVYHSMITNATLLKGKAIEVFKKYPLHSIQITFDGKKEQHDKVKFHQDGSGTYDEILENISVFVKECPYTRIALRVNIDNTNSRDYPTVYNELSNTFSKANIQIYPAILKQCTECDASNFMNSTDICRFNKMIRSCGISKEIYPQRKDKICAAIKIGSYAIGPRGEIYNCWEDMGQKDSIIGSIYEKAFSNVAKKADYMHYGSIFNDPRCRECPILPICFGGCPKRRIENQIHGQTNNICSTYADNNHESLKETLLDFYYSGKWKK